MGWGRPSSPLRHARTATVTVDGSNCPPVGCGAMGGQADHMTPSDVLCRCAEARIELGHQRGLREWFVQQ